ncbi:sporulation protein [Cupriavidus sp. SK-3]|uniref:LysR family transcriptional regulator n=1 Tax=Cupriavidus TaxID=106589 RepID=UPI000446D597|nr:MULTISPECIES: LysR substrate-binding domain-containing protein [Cupriavidus]KDP86974.1 sporulation protein [Cupriavidus sp. SK-3]MDF3882413.1 LysR substrate-binding domain-containing protein [Cupriavidus basilensis]
MTTSGRLQHSLATRLKFRHLTLLLALEKQRSVSRVAAEMNLSQPAVTKALHEVEEIFLAPLFIRARRGLEPTATGSAVLAHARLVMADTEALGHELTAIEAGLHGRLRLGVIPYVSTAVLDAVCAHCLEQTPAVSVLVHEGTTDELVAALRAHEIDCAIARIYCSPGEDIVQTQLYAEEPTIVVHAAAARRLSASALDWGKLAGLDWILPPDHTPIRRTIDTLFATASAAPPVAIVETFSIKTMAALLRVRPRAITIVPRGVAEELVARGGAMLSHALQWDLPAVGAIWLRRAEHRGALEGLARALRGAAA